MSGALRSRILGHGEPRRLSVRRRSVHVWMRSSTSVGPSARPAIRGRTRRCDGKVIPSEVSCARISCAERAPDMQGINKTVDAPLVNVPYEELCPGAKALEDFLDEFRERASLH